MWEIKDVKARGRAAFKANYWVSVLVGFILTLLISGGTVAGRNSMSDTTEQVPSEVQSSLNELGEAVDALPEDTKAAIALALLGGFIVILVIGIVLKIFVWNPIEVGCYRFFAKNVEHAPAPFGCVGEGFGNYGHVLVTLLVRDLLIILWTLLLIVPGIMKAYSYQLVPYIIKDEPKLSAKEVLARSSQLMYGNRWRAFLMDLSFIGWGLLGLLTFGIVNIFWTTPYFQSAQAALYLELTGR